MKKMMSHTKIPILCQRIDDTLDDLSGAKWFYALDLKSGYWQVQIDGNSKETAFYWEWIMAVHDHAIPALLCPSTFEQLMEQVMVGLPASVALVYLHDILVPGCTLSKGLARCSRG